MNGWRRGFTVFAPQLAGHDGTVAKLNATRWPEWVDGVEVALAELRARCGRVAVAGLSLGGLLALHAARRHADLAGVISLGAPLWLARWATVTTRVLSRLGIATFPKSGVDVRDPIMRARVPTFDVFPIEGMNTLLDFMAIVRAELPGITVPAFVAHGALDRAAPPAGAREIIARLGAREVRTLSLPRSGHLVTVDLEREKLAVALSEFLQERMPA